MSTGRRSSTPGQSKRVTATLKIDGVTYDSVGVRLKGNSSYFAPARAEKKKLPFNIKVSYTNKKQMVNGKYRTLKLSNLFRDPSYLRETLSYQIARDYVAAPECNYAGRPKFLGRELRCRQGRDV